ncbi:MAG TPA: hypothetical protein PL064_08615, partial [Thermogutta sp.]|nr:hypothetical protein [Thermogutta sp.]
MEQLNLEFRPSGKNGHTKVILRQGGEVVFCDTVNLSSAKARDRFLDGLVERFPGLRSHRNAIETKLLQQGAERDHTHDVAGPEPQGQAIDL